MCVNLFETIIKYKSFSDYENVQGQNLSAHLMNLKLKKHITNH